MMKQDTGRHDRNIYVTGRSWIQVVRKWQDGTSCAYFRRSRQSPGICRQKRAQYGGYIKKERRKGGRLDRWKGRTWKVIQAES